MVDKKKIQKFVSRNTGTIEFRDKMPEDLDKALDELKSSYDRPRPSKASLLWAAARIGLSLQVPNKD